MRRFLGWAMGWGLVVLGAASCGGVEHEAEAIEASRVSRETCAMGSFEQVQRCGGLPAVCHVCARLEGEGQCVQPCVLGGTDCPTGQMCRPIAELRDAGGYARIGDCPAGYCR